MKIFHWEKNKIKKNTTTITAHNVGNLPYRYSLVYKKESWDHEGVNACLSYEHSRPI